MTDEQARDGFREVYNDFWIRYKNRQPTEGSSEWERMHSWAAVLRKKYPFLDEVVNRMLTEFVERSRKRGRREDAFHMPPC